MKPSPHIFRQYDIRGIVGEDLDASVAEAVGHAYGSALRNEVDLGDPRVVVGRDNRHSSPELAGGVISGIRSSGVSVVDVGTVPTPLVYWAEKTLGATGGLQITGSHNPPEYNGIKMTVEGRSLYGDAIQDLLRRIRERDLEEGQGGLEERRVIENYVEDLSRRFDLSRELKVVVDCGNGAGSLVAVELLRAVGADVVPLFCESDGTFPNHHPDPTVDENLVDLIEKVRQAEAAVGIGFDGDADRIGVVDDQGEVVRGDVLLLLFGLDLIERQGPGQKLVFDVKCSQVLPEVFEERGGRPIMWKTGHSLMKEKMREEGAPLAGELSGHICFADQYFGFDDALYAACRLVDLLTRADRPLSEMVAELPAYVSTPELRIEVTEESKFQIVQEARDHFAGEREVIDVDGVRVLFGDGWGLLRASNTQPVLVARYEAKTEDRLEQIRHEMESWLRARGVEL